MPLNSRSFTRSLDSICFLFKRRAVPSYDTHVHKIHLECTLNVTMEKWHFGDSRSASRTQSNARRSLWLCLFSVSNAYLTMAVCLKEEGPMEGLIGYLYSEAKCHQTKSILWCCKTLGKLVEHMQWRFTLKNVKMECDSLNPYRDIKAITWTQTGACFRWLRSLSVRRLILSILMVW